MSLKQWVFDFRNMRSGVRYISSNKAISLVKKASVYGLHICN